jgi:DNA-binding NtrC family response regulator
MFSPSYPIRVIVLARTTSHARRALGHQHWRPLMHVALCPLARRRPAIPRLLDDWFAASGSVLRVADLSPANQRALLRNPWRENLHALRQTAVRLDAIVRAGFSRKKAAAALGIPRMTFYGWFNETMQFVRPLVNEPEKSVLLAKLPIDAADRP